MRVHTPIPSSSTDFEKAQSLAQPTQGEVGFVEQGTRQQQAPKSTDPNAAYNLRNAEHHMDPHSKAQAAAAIREAEARVNQGKRSPLTLLFLLLIAASIGYGFIFFVRHWADKNIPSTRASAKW